MSSYNAVAGIDEEALKRFITDFYSCAREDIFHRMVSVVDKGLEPLTSVEYEVLCAPTVGFIPAIRTAQPNGGSSASLELCLDHFTLTLHYSGGQSPTTMDGRLHATADLVGDAAGDVLIPRLTSTTLNIEDEEKLSEIFNMIISPHLDAFVQSHLLDPIRVPVIRTGDLTLNGPTLTTSEAQLLITEAVAPARPEPASLDEGWPHGVVFVAADFPLVNELVKHQLLPRIGTHRGDWSKTIKLGIGQSTIKASYSATVTRLTLAPAAGQTSTIEGTATISAAMTAKAKHLFNVSGTGVAQATVTAEAVLNDSNGLGVRITGLKPFSLLFSVAGPAAGFARYVQIMSNAASGVLHDAIGAALRDLPLLEMGAIPGFEIPIDDRVYVVRIADPAIQALNCDGHTLLLATAVPEVELRPAAP